MTPVKLANGKLLVIGSLQPAIVKLLDKTVIACSSHIYDAADDIKFDDIVYMQSFNQFKLKYVPRWHDEYVQHMQAMSISKEYAKRFNDYCIFKYQQQYPETYLYDIDVEPSNTVYYDDAVIKLKFAQMRLAITTNDINKFNDIIERPMNQDNTIQRIKVDGSNNQVYDVILDKNKLTATCTCKGYTFNSKCKHATSVVQNYINFSKQSQS